MVVPTGNVEPDVAVPVKVTKPQLSVAVGVFQTATAPPIVAFVVPKKLAGQFIIVGLRASAVQGSDAPLTVMEKEQVDTFFLASAAV